MTTYEKLLQEATHQGIDIYEKPMPPKIKGLYADNTICINNRVSTNTEKACVLAEELGHHFTTSGNILDQMDITNRKQENRGRAWSYEKLVPLSKLVQAAQVGIRNRYELADFLEVTEDFLDSALNRYKEKLGVKVTIGKYLICFDPLLVFEMFE